MPHAVKLLWKQAVTLALWCFYRGNPALAAAFNPSAGEVRRIGELMDRSVSGRLFAHPIQ
jgi:hypothetical protein